MYRTAFLGVENSHADTFLRFMKEDKDGEFSDIEAAGVYSVDPAASAKLHEKYGVPVMESPDELAGRVDGVIVTARHGDFHLPYAKPYLSCGIPAFIDKPVTVSESDARELASLLEKYRVPYTGGSCLKYSPSLLALRDAHLSGEGGKTVGGVLRCPISMSSPYGGFYFYAQHLVEAVITVFGDGIKTVGAHRTASGATAVFSYDCFDVTGCFTEGIYRYEAYRFAEKESSGGVFPVDAPCFLEEFRAFHRLLRGEGENPSAEHFMKPVFVMNAAVRSFASGREEPVGVLCPAGDAFDGRSQQSD